MDYDVQPGYRESLTQSKDQAARTPRRLLDQLNREFGPFDFDPCPAVPAQMDSERRTVDNLDPASIWGHRNFVNPPYDDVGAWLEKAVHEADEHGAMSLFLIPARTWTAWFHDWVMPFASVVRFLRGVVAFEGYATPLSTPLMLVLIEGQERGHPLRQLLWQRQEATLRRPVMRVRPVVQALEIEVEVEGAGLAQLKTVAAVSTSFASAFGFELLRIAAGQLPSVAQLSTAPRLFLVHQSRQPVAKLLASAAHMIDTVQGLKSLALLVPARMGSKVYHEAALARASRVYLIRGGGQLRGHPAARRPFVHGSIIVFGSL